MKPENTNQTGVPAVTGQSGGGSFAPGGLTPVNPRSAFSSMDVRPAPINQIGFTPASPAPAQVLPTVPLEPAAPAQTSGQSYAPAPAPARRRTLSTLKMAGIFTVFMVVMVGATYLFSRNGEELGPGVNNQGVVVPEQDLGSEVELDDIVSVPEAETLIINGDVQLQGSLDLSSGGFSGQLGQGDLTGDQTYTLPDASGTVCLDANNCDYAAAAGLTALQADFTSLLITGILNGQTVGANSSFTGNATIAGNVTIGGALAVDAISADGTNAIIVPNAAGTMCLSTGNCAGSGGYGDILQGGNAFGGELSLGTTDNFAFTLKANDATALTILPTGQVGIGTTTPGSKLTIQTTDWGLLSLRATAADGHADIDFTTRNTADTADVSPLQMFMNDSGGAQFWSFGSGTLFMSANRVGVNLGGKPGATNARLEVRGRPGDTVPVANIEGAAGQVNLQVKGAASQTADLTQWMNSSGTILARINAAGRLQFNNGAAVTYLGDPTSSGVNNLIVSQGATALPLAIQGAASQAGDLTQWQNSSGGQVAAIGATGYAGFGGNMLSGSVGVSITVNTSTHVGVRIRGAASQSANLQEWQDSAGGLLARIGATGWFLANGGVYGGTGASSTSAQNAFRPASSNVVALEVRGVASQTANLQEWHNSAGGLLAHVSPVGHIGAATIGSNAGSRAYIQISDETNERSLTVHTNGSTNKGLVVKGVASQTANLQEWQNSSGSVIAKVTASGGLSATGDLTILSNNGQSHVYVGNQTGSTSINLIRGTTAHDNFLDFDTGSASQWRIGRVGADTTESLFIRNANAANIMTLTQNGTITIQSNNNGAQPLIVKGAISQLADLQQWQNSSGTILTRVTSNGHIRIGDAIGGALDVYPDAANRVLIVARGFSGQSADLHQWQANDGTIQSYVDSAGRFRMRTTVTDGTLAVSPNATNTVGVIIQGLASQTADLQRWQNSGGMVLGRVDSSGNILTEGQLYAQEGNASQVIIGAQAGGAGLVFGSASDTNLYRSQADTLATDDGLIVNNGSAGGQVWIESTGRITFGNLTDTNLYRSAASNLKTDDVFRSASSLVAYDGLAGQIQAGGDSSTAMIWFGNDGGLRLYRSASSLIRTDDALAADLAVMARYGSAGVVEVGSSATVPTIQFGADTNLYRSAADTLKTDDTLAVAGRLGVGGATLGVTDAMTVLGGNITLRELDNGNDSVILGTNNSRGYISLLRDGATNIEFNALSGAANYINNDGNFAVGTSTPTLLGSLGGSDDRFLQVHTSAGGTANLTLSTSSTVAQTVGEVSFGSTGLSAVDKRIASIVAAKADAATTNPSGHLDFYTSNGAAIAHQMRLSNAGALRLLSYGAGTLTTDASGNITASSDERLKDVQGQFNRGLSDILNLNPILYKWNGLSGLETSSTYAGFSAQNVQVAIPEAVATDSRGYLTLQDRPVLAASVNAIKEVHGNVQSLEGRVSALEAAVGANPTFASLNVTGAVNLNSLTVVNATITGNLTIAGHVITAGNAPAVLGATTDVTIEGNDTAGTITVTATEAMAAGKLANVNFSLPFSGGKKPRVILSAGNQKAAAAQFYTDKSTATNASFELFSLNGLEAGQTYVIDYWVVE